MFSGIGEFFALVGIHPIWPILIVATLFASCAYPYRLEEKIKETKDENGNTVYKVYRKKFKD